MSVFLTIINIVLMAILLILLLVLILMLIVLFTPIKYNIRVSYIEEDLGYNIRVFWLLRLVSLQMRRADGVRGMTFRIAWKYLLNDEDTNKVTSEPKEESEQTEKKERDPPKEAKETKAETKTDEPHVKDDTAKEDNGGKLGFIDKLKNAYNKVLERIKSYNELVEGFNNLGLDVGELLSDIKLMLKRLFLALRPRVFFLDLELGLETPDLTGMIIGGLAVLEETIESFNRKRYKVNIKGDFEEKAMSFKTDIRGKVSLWNIIWPFIRLYFAKSMKPIRKMIIDKLFRSKKTRRNTNGK